MWIVVSRSGVRFRTRYSLGALGHSGGNLDRPRSISVLVRGCHSEPCEPGIVRVDPLVRNDRVDEQLLRDSFLADQSIGGLVPMVDASFLVTQGDAHEAIGLD